MARGAQTDVAVLAALSVAPMSGYVLRAEIRRTLGHFWSESFGQIYPALTRLSAQGLIARSPGETDAAPSATYHLTVAGRARLVELLSAPPVSVPPRNGLLLRLFFGEVLGDDACRRLVLDAREQARRGLVELGEARREAADGTHPDQEKYFLITISAGEHAFRAALAWVDETLAVLDGGAAEESSAPA